MRLLMLIAIVSVVESLITEGVSGDKDVMLTDNKAMVVPLSPNSSLTIHTKVENSVTYVVCQVHSQKNSVTLSMKPQIEYGSSKYGQDVGVVTVVNGKTDLTWYLYSNSTTDFNVLLHVTFLFSEDPIPGGCNEEFNLENDPNLKLNVRSTITDVQFQWSNIGIKDGRLPQCEDRAYNSYLEYKVYVSYIEGGDFTEQTYIDMVQSMLAAGDITKHGRHLKTIENDKGLKSIANITSYSQQGVLYVVVVRNKQSGAVSAYIPAVTYACDLQDTDACKHKDVIGIILSTLGAILGVFLCFFGHRFFKTGTFLFGFLMFAIIAFQVTALETEISLIGSLSLAGIIGLLGGALLLSFWWNCGIPILSVLFIGLVGGYLISCVVFYTPFANLTYWDSPFNYGAMFSCVVLVVPVILLYFTRFLNIFSCALVGSYSIIVALDTYLGSGMRYIVLNAIRHGTDRDYVKVTVSGPFTLSEIILTVVWAIVFLSGIAFQVLRERKKAPFPPCPKQLRNNRDLRTLLRRSTREREPLIRGDNPVNYGTSQEVTASSTGELSEEEVNNKPKMV